MNADSSIDQRKVLEELREIMLGLWAPIEIMSQINSAIAGYPLPYKSLLTSEHYQWVNRLIQADDEYQARHRQESVASRLLRFIGVK